MRHLWGAKVFIPGMYRYRALDSSVLRPTLHTAERATPHTAERSRRTLDGHEHPGHCSSIHAFSEMSCKERPRSGFRGRQE